MHKWIHCLTHALVCVSVLVSVYVAIKNAYGLVIHRASYFVFWLFLYLVLSSPCSNVGNIGEKYYTISLILFLPYEPFCILAFIKFPVSACSELVVLVCYALTCCIAHITVFLWSKSVKNFERYSLSK